MIPVFLALTFAISLAGFACIYAIPAARSPESATGLPFWLVMVWGPSLAAIIVAGHSGELAELLARAVRVSSVPLPAWALVVAPIVLLLALRPVAPEAATPLSMGALAGLVVLNLFLGPLGEELGWRGLLQEHLTQRMGWLDVSLLVGVIWLTWHLPLWTIDSPHSLIALPLFAGHVMLYSVIIGAAYTISGGSIVPAILIHLMVNLAANLAVFAGYRDPNAWFSASLGWYAAIAACAWTIVYASTAKTGLQIIDP